MKPEASRQLCCRSDITLAQPLLIVTPPQTKPATEPVVVTSVDTKIQEDSYVYVHCYFKNPGTDALIRIWKTTYLVDQASGSKSSLVHAENISFAPLWTRIPDNTLFSFLLIFSALPKVCQRFDLKEEISQPGGFLVTDIQRNETDVYHVDLL